MASALALSEFSRLHIVYGLEAIAEGALRAGFIQSPEEEVSTYVQEIRQQHSKNMNVLIDESVNKLGQDAVEYIKPQTHLTKGT